MIGSRFSWQLVSPLVSTGFRHSGQKVAIKDLSRKRAMQLCSYRGLWKKVSCMGWSRDWVENLVAVENLCAEIDAAADYRAWNKAHPPQQQQQQVTAPSEASVNSRGESNKPKARLPKIELPKFSDERTINWCLIKDTVIWGGDVLQNVWILLLQTVTVSFEMC